ncbi:winged helix-turn-helix domain-containing protein [Halopiger djelfimassiliensis]|uniref:winged helix-turn-helix domain-containing protein n=1 Tax=Halopiger djelfimassiliensis TaxID=1293047 RepID=UPI00067778D6|nr:helix-turn-helix domain-containing protein [Halopiger djelfimassiliensis]
MRPDRSRSTDPTAVRDEALEALDALANEHRIAILRALADADGPLSFSELREEIEMRDTGRFNYHLTELLGRFVRETPDGYRLGPAGKRVVLAGADLGRESATLLAESDAPQSDGDCPVCGESNCDRVVHLHLSSTDPTGRSRPRSR